MADEVEPATSTGKAKWGKIAAYVAGGIVCVLALPSPRASMNSGDQGSPGSGTRYSSSANWNNVVPTLLFQPTAGRVTSPAQVAQVCPPGAVVAVAFAKLNCFEAQPC